VGVGRDKWGPRTWKGHMQAGSVGWSGTRACRVGGWLGWLAGASNNYWASPTLMVELAATLLSSHFFSLISAN
jgi:hypothetical protein